MRFLRKRFRYANIVATLALVFAMTGGAYAASRYVITSTKQISPKVLKSLKGAAGSKGAPGATGAAGPAGPAGPTGPAGPKGETGAGGSNGANGSNGASVTSKALTTSDAACGKQGGSEFTSASGNTTACNGSPWAVGGLPKGATETGHWNLSQYEKGAQIIQAPISFTVSLAKALPNSAAHYIEAGATPPEGCKGTVEKPEAASGNLCVFAAAAPQNVAEAAIGGFGEIEEESVGADIAGARVLFRKASVEEEYQASAYGTWAVTG